MDFISKAGLHVTYLWICIDFYFYGLTFWKQLLLRGSHSSKLSYFSLSSLFSRNSLHSMTSHFSTVSSLAWTWDKSMNHVTGLFLTPDSYMNKNQTHCSSHWFWSKKHTWKMDGATSLLVKAISMYFHILSLRETLFTKNFPELHFVQTLILVTHQENTVFLHSTPLNEEEHLENTPQ